MTLSSVVVQDGSVQQAAEDVRNDRTETNWLLLGYAEGAKDQLVVQGTGAGGLDELKQRLADDQAAFAYVRFVVGNDELSRRAKFVLVSWCGENVRVLRKAKLSVHIAEVKRALPSFAVEVAASTADELDEDRIQLLLKKAMGANYDRQTSQY